MLRLSRGLEVAAIVEIDEVSPQSSATTQLSIRRAACQIGLGRDDRDHVAVDDECTSPLRSSQVRMGDEVMWWR